MVCSCSSCLPAEIHPFALGWVGPGEDPQHRNPITLAKATWRREIKIWSTKQFISLCYEEYLSAWQEQGHVFPAPSTDWAAASTEAERSGRQLPNVWLAWGVVTTFPCKAHAKQGPSGTRYGSTRPPAIPQPSCSRTGLDSWILSNTAEPCSTVLALKELPKCHFPKDDWETGKCSVLLYNKKTCLKSEQPSATGKTRNKTSLSLQPTMKSPLFWQVAVWPKVDYFDNPNDSNLQRPRRGMQRNEVFCNWSLKSAII